MKLVLTTSVLENYGAHTWDGEGECPVNWKAKGGSEYIVEDYSFVDADSVEADAERLSSLLTQNNEFFQIDVVSWELVEDDYVPYFEKQQIEYEGVATYKEPRLTLEGVAFKSTLGQDGKYVVHTDDLNKEEVFFKEILWDLSVIKNLLTLIICMLA